MSHISENWKDNDLALMLKKASQPKVSKDFSQAVMSRINQAEARTATVKRYLRYSWVFIGIAVLFAFKAVSFINAVQSFFSTWLNALLPGLSDTLGYIVLIIVAGMVLYELNLLVSQYFNRKTENTALI